MRNKQVKTRSYGYLVLMALTLGVLFYPVFRADKLPWFFNLMPWLQDGVMAHWLDSTALVQSIRAYDSYGFVDSVPSLIHAFVSVLVISLVGTGADRRTRWIWLSILIASWVICEVSIGWFSWLDMLALLLGFSVAQALLILFPGSVCSRLTGEMTRRLGLGAAVLGSSLLAMGSYYTDGFFTGECARYDEQGICEEYKRPGVPVYMSYQQLRSSVALEAARAPDRIGRVYLYRDHVFLNERNEGIHIIDNQDPSAPVNVGFIRVPGNTEIAIRGNYLYADSYVDLVTLDLNNLAAISLLNRQENIFPYDAFQNIPNNVSFTNADINSSYGVVVSYRLSES